MDIVVQHAITIFAVFVAVCYVLRQAWLVLKKQRAGCGGGCKTCAVKDRTPDHPPQPFISADDLTESYRR